MDHERLFHETKHFDPEKHFPDSWSIDRGFNSEFASYSEKLGFYLTQSRKNHKNEWHPGSRALTNSQIRNFFGEVKRLQMYLGSNPDDERWKNIKTRFILLKPKLAYAAGRALSKNKGNVIGDFEKVLSRLIDEVRPDEPGAALRFLTFVDFFEAVLAYHKAYGGRE